MNQLRAWLLKLPRHQKRLIQVLADTVLVFLALWIAFLVRLGISEMINPFRIHLVLFLLLPVIVIPLFSCCGMYRAIMRYFGNDALITIIKAVSLSALIFGIVLCWYNKHQNIAPQSIIFNYWWLSLIMIGGLRLTMRQYFVGDWFDAVQHAELISSDGCLPRVAIYGAGSAGNQLVAALRMGRLMQPVAFIDDDNTISTSVISGLQVYKPKHIQRMINTTGAQEILLAIPSSNRSRRREILEFLEGFSIHVRSVPGFIDFASRMIKVDDIQEIDIADLLGRDSILAQADLLGRCIKGQSVLVTGAGGSIGSELCRQILELRPKTLLLFEHSEFNLYGILCQLEQRVYRKSLPVNLLPILGSVRDSAKLLDVMQAWRVDTVYHAAAYKHVPIVEHNIAEGVLNNVFGTLNAAQAAVQAGVANFVLISTDKAVRPTSVMGSTKRLAELILQALSRKITLVLFGDTANVSRINKTRFTIVRFGNVLGSSGSVIPLFYKQIKSGGPLTVTHPKITRYFMTISEAAQLVIQAGSIGQGGDVFVLDMGEPVKIVELAEKMIHLSGLSVRSSKNPDGDIAIEFSGLRPGEKLYEELLIGDNVVVTQHPMIMSASEDYLPWELLKPKLLDLLTAVDQGDFNRVRQLLRDTVSGYTPNGEIVDWIYQQHQLNQ
uniref:polysaccharide biosynthesis protein n=1 Tax=Candidatus Pseudomonas adelgestsugas TaxID=1302376 RepID=UPI00100E45BB|nr:nucleoside-diphosphate sugar epimerase/dehydratase [Candidatus Pseudomonas adelgestsugas]